MICRNCNNVINDKKCPICGFNNGFRISIGTILSILFLAVVIIGTICLFISSVNGMSEAGENAYFGIVMLASAGAIVIIGAILIPYYLIVLIVSIICDYNVKKARIVQNTIVIIFLMVPVMFATIFNLILMRDTNKKTFNFPDVTIKMPSNMNRYSFGKDSITNEDKSAGFVTKDNKCKINIGRYNYDEDIDLIHNFKNVCDRGNLVDENTNIYSLYDKISSLKTTSINGKTWSYHKGNYDYIEYRMYGIVINDNLYKIEYESKDKNICEPLLEKTLNSVKYK